MKKECFNVIFVFSIPDKEFDDYLYRSFFLLNRENINLHSVEEFAEFVEADFNQNCFRDRYIPRTKKVVIIPIGERSDSRDVALYKGDTAETEVRIPDTTPGNKNYDAVIVDLMLSRYKHTRGNSQFYKPHGLGIVSWAVMNGIPVGLVYEDSSNADFRQGNFWLESTLDTLGTHPMCQGELISGDIREVCLKMYHFLNGE